LVSQVSGFLAVDAKPVTRARKFHPPSAPVIALALVFALLFYQPFVLLLDDWWTNPEAGHGLLLAPVALWLAWRSRNEAIGQPNRPLGIVVLGFATVLRYVSGLAAELFTMRVSMVLAAVGIVLYFQGVSKVRHWWLPFTLLLLSIPLPELIVNAIAIPLQFRASRMGAALLQMRYVPVRLEGNVILLPQHRLFVTEACSGLRSLTALLSLGVLAGGLWLKRPISRIALLAAAIPVAVILNGIRVFLTGFLVYFVSPKMGDGFMHLTEGWLIFVIAFVILGGFAWALASAERWWARRHAAQ
jgi:exosortase